MMIVRLSLFFDDSVRCRALQALAVRAAHTCSSTKTAPPKKSGPARGHRFLRVEFLSRKRRLFGVQGIEEELREFFASRPT